jgi:hypothetical protein
MTQTLALFHHCRVLLWIESDVAVVFIDTGLEGTAAPSDVHLPALLGDCIKAQLFQAKIILHGPKEAGGLHACNLKLC